MIKKLYPTSRVQSVFEIDVAGLKAQGIKGMIFDIDNTLVPYDISDPTDELIAFFEKLKEEGMHICLASNNTQDRVIKFNEKLKVFAIHKAKKPSRRALYKAMEKMGLDKSEVVMIGDQVFTDVYAGNRAGVMTLLVTPVSEKDEWITKIKRGIERKVITHYEKNHRKN